MRIAKSSAPPFQNGFSSLGPNSTGKEASLIGTQGTEASVLPPPAAHPGRSLVTPGSLLQHLWCGSWNLPRLSWLSWSLSQISFSKAFHSVWITASGSHQLDILFLFSSESLLLPRVSHQWGGCWEQELLFSWCVTTSAGPEDHSNGGEYGVFSCETQETSVTARLAALWPCKKQAE